METTQVLPPADRGRRRRRWRGTFALVVGTAGVLLAAVLGCRYTVGSDAEWFAQRTSNGCANEYCFVEVEQPDLLVVPGRRDIEVHVLRQEDARKLTVSSPFAGSFGRTSFQAETDGGITIVGDAVRLTFTGKTLTQLKN